MRDAIVGNWFKNLLVTFPVGYRDLFIDEFIVLTFPCLVLLIVVRRRRTPGYLWFALPGLYGLAFHNRHRLDSGLAWAAMRRRFGPAATEAT